MVTLSNIKFIGDILVYAEPYLSLYYDYQKKEYALFLRVSHTENKYLFFYVEKENVIKFMNESIGLRDIAKGKKIYSTQKRHNGSFMKVNESVHYEDINGFKSNEMFDPDYCLEYCEIIWLLNN